MTDVSKTIAQWYRQAVVYQVFPHSFYDADQDGVGDVQGLIERLDYIRRLGATAIRVTLYDSAFAMPADVDSVSAHDNTGTAADRTLLADAAHGCGLRVLTDWDLGFTSHHHPWFVQACSDVANPYRAYYCWQNGRGRSGKLPPKRVKAAGFVWRYHAATAQWYLCYINDAQPVLDWSNADMRRDMLADMQQWLQPGVDGLYFGTQGLFASGKTDAFQVVQQTIRPLLDTPDFVAVLCLSPNSTIAYSSRNARWQGIVLQPTQHLVMPRFAGRVAKPKLTTVKRVVDQRQANAFGVGWLGLQTQDHNLPRALGLLEGDCAAHRTEAACAMATAMHFLQGTPQVYQGEEWGLPNIVFDNVSAMRDIALLERLADKRWRWLPWRKRYLLALYNKTGNDNARLPMPWDNAPLSPSTADTSAVTPQQKEAVQDYFRRLIALRQDSTLAPIIIHGTFCQYYADSNELLCYRRSYRGQDLIVVANLSDKNVPFAVPNQIAFNQSQLVIANYQTPVHLGTVTLRPYECVVYTIK